MERHNLRFVVRRSVKWQRLAHWQNDHHGCLASMPAGFVPRRTQRVAHTQVVEKLSEHTAIIPDTARERGPKIGIPPHRLPCQGRTHTGSGAWEGAGAT
jgi:hypothetical protein